MLVEFLSRKTIANQENDVNVRFAIRILLYLTLVLPCTHWTFSMTMGCEGRHMQSPAVLLQKELATADEQESTQRSPM